MTDELLRREALNIRTVYGIVTGIEAKMHYRGRGPGKNVSDLRTLTLRINYILFTPPGIHSEPTHDIFTQDFDSNGKPLRGLKGLLLAGNGSEWSTGTVDYRVRAAFLLLTTDQKLSQVIQTALWAFYNDAPTRPAAKTLSLHTDSARQPIQGYA